MRYSKTPLRVSLFGGGTDDPNYFNDDKACGLVSGFTINQFVWIFSSEIQVNQGFKFRLGYRENEDVLKADDIKHPIFREILNDFPHLPSFHFSTMSSLPSGAGLGSSSSFTVGLLAVIGALNGDMLSRASLANEAIRYERVVLGEIGGWQDQLHAAFGGLNTFEFKDNTWRRKPVDINKTNLSTLSDSLYILYTGKLRSASVIEQSKDGLQQKKDLLSETYKLGLEGEKALMRDPISLEHIGRLLNEGWVLKRSLSNSVSSLQIDQVYEKIMSSGVYGAKLCGAGGGGFFLVLADPEAADRLGTIMGIDKIMRVSVYSNGVEVGVL